MNSIETKHRPVECTDDKLNKTIQKLRGEIETEYQDTMLLRLDKKILVIYDQIDHKCRHTTDLNKFMYNLNQLRDEIQDKLLRRCFFS